LNYEITKKKLKSNHLFLLTEFNFSFIDQQWIFMERRCCRKKWNRKWRM